MLPRPAPPHSLRDPSAFSAAFRAHAPHAFAVAQSVLRDRDAAEDVVQDVFATLWARPDQFEPDRGGLATFIRVMARSRALDRIRSSNVAATATSKLRSLHAVERSAADVAEEREVVRALTNAAGALPPTQRVAVLLHHVHGFGDRELADVTGAPLGTVKSRIRLGTRRLRAQSLEVAT